MRLHVGPCPPRSPELESLALAQRSNGGCSLGVEGSWSLIPFNLQPRRLAWLSLASWAPGWGRMDRGPASAPMSSGRPL